MLAMELRAGGGRDERRLSDRRRSEREGAGDPGTEVILKDGTDAGRASGREGDLVGKDQPHRKLVFWTQDGSCYEGSTPHLGGTLIFVESTWMAPLGTELTISLVPKEEHIVGQELGRGMVVWHCPFGDEFKNQGGFGVAFQRQWPREHCLAPVGTPREAA